MAPADGNMAPVSGQDQQVQPASYSPSAAQDQDSDGQYQDDSYDEGPEYQVPQPPPELPQYSQPPAPGDNYIWTPGYWYWDSNSGGYYWVPGAWVLAPFVGALWTPGYWGWYGGYYHWYPGYWGPYIGFYGGVDYGFGYTGHGYYGGRWNNGYFNYNRSVTNVNTTVINNTYIYNQRVVNNVNNNYRRVSYNGGQGGITVRPTPAEITAGRQRRLAPLPTQTQHARAAAANPQQFASRNHGRPASLVVAKPLATSYKRPAAHAPAPRPLPASRTNEARPGAANRPGATRPANRPGEATHGTGARPAGRPTPAARPEARPALHPSPAAHPEGRPAAHPVAHPARRPAAHPAEHARPEARPAAHQPPRSAAHPAPRPAAHPAARPAHHPQEKHPEPQNHQTHP